MLSIFTRYTDGAPAGPSHHQASLAGDEAASSGSTLSSSNATLKRRRVATGTSPLRPSPARDSAGLMQELVSALHSESQQREAQLDEREARLTAREDRLREREYRLNEREARSAYPPSVEACDEMAIVVQSYVLAHWLYGIPRADLLNGPFQLRGLPGGRVPLSGLGLQDSIRRARPRSTAGRPADSRSALAGSD